MNQVDGLSFQWQVIMAALAFEAIVLFLICLPLPEWIVAPFARVVKGVSRFASFAMVAVVYMFIAQATKFAAHQSCDELKLSDAPYQRCLMKTVKYQRNLMMLCLHPVLMIALYRVSIAIVKNVDLVKKIQEEGEQKKEK